MLSGTPGTPSVPMLPVMANIHPANRVPLIFVEYTSCKMSYSVELQGVGVTETVGQESGRRKSTPLGY